MTPFQYLRILWARKWIVLSALLLVSIAGTLITLFVLPKQYVAEASMVVEVRADPVLGALAPGMASAAYMATQVEILRSDRVAMRVVKMLGVERSPAAVQQWRESTNAKIPLDRYFANLLQNGLSVEPTRGSNVINIRFVNPDAAFAAAAANAFAQAHMDVSVELRVEPARQSAAWLDEQTKSLRTNLENSQSRLSKFQQEKGIVVSDERIDLENAKLSSLLGQLAQAEAEHLATTTQQRLSGSELSPDVQASPSVQNLKGQLVAAQTRLSEMSGVVGPNHPQRQAIDAQIRELRQQLSAEIARVTGGSSVMTRGTAQKVAELREKSDEQKKYILSLRSQRDEMDVLVRDVETARRAYDGASGRVQMLSLESQNTQANLRLLSPAIEPYAPSRPRVMVNIVGSIAGGLLLGGLLALGLELLDRRIRDPEDMAAVAGVPVIGVLRPIDSKRPVFRRMTSGGPYPPSGRALLAAPGAR
ncbi:chain length determinant protein EpsF [Piscinibacter sp.]|uniref:chain length determinant protein EpsF n=1 Tax=Piscinibacter sp. TaxID=1903157 RepID=UPI002C43827D|nr:chain length determinant protein EpsF [Albitalea sp.]HUG22119.1 chain length determinant protein EpsF [Albitalea sp.]